MEEETKGLGENQEEIQEPEKENEEPENAGEETPEPEKTDGKDSEELEPEVDEIEELLKPKKSGAEKRIDKLVAQLRAAEEKLAKLESQKPEEKKTKYTRGQLSKAIKDAIENQDADLLMDAIDYRVKEERELAEKEIIANQQKHYQAQQAQTQEWQETLQDFAELVDPNEPEMYVGAHEELDIKNQNSALFRLASNLYTNPENASKYQKPGGQRLAVTDALTKILRVRQGKTAGSIKAKTLEKRLAKERRKTSLSGGRPPKEEEGPPRLMTDEERVDDYLKERREMGYQ